MLLRIFPIVFVLILAVACSEEEKVPPIYNPAASSFDTANSDAMAIAYADTVMEAMGGRKNWDSTRYLSWEFMGSRYLVWDRESGNVRIEAPSYNTTILMNVKETTGRAWKDSAEVTHPDSLAELLHFGEQVWVNDSYWLVFPFKLKDSNTTLKYLGKKQVTLGEKKGEEAHVLEMTFINIGFTPENKYHVYIPVKGEKRICQWDYFGTADETTPTLSTSWDAYQKHGRIYLTGKHSDDGTYELSKIAVHDTLPASVFESFDPIEL